MSDAINRLNTALQGRYSVESELGAGGMATVYLAHDLKHERKVALKVLKPELAAVVGAERFLAEIKTTANLQHPHILPLYDSGEASGMLFYVMPHVEGESLRDRLDREHQLPVENAVRIATDVAEALDYAHRQGVIHRDMKPANILLQDGKPVISDFGIALAVRAGGGGRMTETGLSLGTPHYMSPEQATGDLDVGPPTDIYALGCVLYEMLVGEPPFTGSNAQAVLARILMGGAPAPADVRPSVPSNVDAAVRRALERTPADRFTSAQRFADALGDGGFRHLEEDGVDTSGGEGRWRAVAIVAGLIAIASLGGHLVALTSRDALEPTARFPQVLGEANVVGNAGGIWLDIARDGQRFVYLGPGEDGGRQLWHRSLDDPAPRPITGTTGGNSPSLSPDGQSVAFGVDGGIRVVPVTGGQPRPVVSAGDWPSWGSDGMIYFVRDGVIHRVPQGGGEAEAVTVPTVGDHQHPDALPDGRGVLLTIAAGAGEESQIAVVGADGGEARQLVPGARARYAAPGSLVYATRDGALWVAPFDLRSLQITGPSVPLVERVAFVSVRSQFAVSQTGTLLHVTDPGALWELVWVDRSGAVEAVDSTWKGGFSTPVLSPDGGRVALSVRGAQWEDVWVMDLGRGTRTRVTSSEAGDTERPSWFLDGDSLLYTSQNALWAKRADGSGEARLVFDEERPVVDGLWSPDGEWLIYRTSSYAGSGDVFAIRVEGDAEPVTVLDSDAAEWQLALSPNGRWLAYSSAESGEPDVYVIPFPDPSAGERVTVSVGGGRAPVWGADGRELFYRSPDDRMVAVRVETEADFALVEWTDLFEWDEWSGGGLSGRAHYAVAADGRFLMLRDATEGSAEIMLTQNFLSELSGRTTGN